MAVDAQGNQIRIAIRALLAAQLLVMDLQVLSGAVGLASPAIATQHLFSQLIVQLGIKPHARALGSNAVHEAFPVTSWRNACRCSPGRNLKNREVRGVPPCRGSLPPEKSAQIISRQ